MTTRPYLYRTKYLTHYTNWGKMITSVMAIIIILAAWIFSDDDWGAGWIAFPVAILVFIGIFFSPVADIAISQYEFHHLKTSFLKFLNKEESFEISTMKSIRSLSGSNKISDGDKYDTLIEMTFKDGSIKSFKVKMLKKDVEECVERVNKMISTKFI